MSERHNQQPLKGQSIGKPYKARNKLRRASKNNKAAKDKDPKIQWMVSPQKQNQACRQNQSNDQNPYERFVSGSDSKYIMRIQEEQVQKEESFEEQNEIERENIKIEQSDQLKFQLKDARTKAQRYSELIANIRQQKKVKQIQPFFFVDQTQKINIHQLLAFTPNKKNGKVLRYNQSTKTCQSIFRCQGCLKDFQNPAALGGHLSKCQEKELHFAKIKLQKITKQQEKNKRIKKLQQKKREIHDQESIKRQNRIKKFMKVYENDERSEEIKLQDLCDR